MKEKNLRNADSAVIPPELAAKAKAGDQAAFTELYELSYRKLYRTIHSMVRDEDLAWDILQDSYIRAWRGLDKLESGEAFLPWLRRIAVNVTATQMAQKRTLTFTDLAGDEDEGAVPDIPDLNMDNQPELALDRQETSRLVREILAELPEAQQMILGMRYYEDMPIQQIAETLRIAPGTVKVQLFRGRKKVETAVRALEKRGVKLYGLSPLPFLLALLRRLEPGQAAEQKALAAVLAEAPAAGGTAAVTVTAMTAGQAFLHGLGAKLLAGALAVALLIGGGKLAYDALKKGTEPPIGIKETTAAETAARDEGETILPTGPTGSGEPALYSGVCGDDLTWRFDPDTGLLTIEGSGVMNSWHDAEPAPWSPFLDKITAVSFPEALFSIGERSFEGCSALRSVTIPENVSVIRPRAFSYCSSLGSVAIPEGVAAIEWMTFGGCSSLRSATIPESVTSIGAYAFSGCPDLTIYGAPGSEAERYANENGIPFQPLEEDPAPTDDDTTTPTEPSEPTEPLIEFPAGTDLGALHLASTAWEAESIEDDKWVGRALDFYADGSLYYREGRMFSEYALYLDGLWRTEEDGTLELILWYSPYDAWDRPDGYQVTAADVPADSWTARFTCEPRKGDCLDLTRQTERGFVNGEEDTWIELHPADPGMEIITLQELRDFGARDDEEYAQLLAGGQDDWDLYGYGGWTKFRGIAKAGSLYAAKVEYSVAFTISAEELAQAVQTGRVTLQGQDYVYVASPEEAAQYVRGEFGGNEYCGHYGGILKLRADGQLDYGYWVERAGDRYYFMYEVGGMIGRLETVEERCWVMLDPETPTFFGPSEYEDMPKTLEECGSVAVNTLSTPAWDDADEFSVHIDMR